MRMGSATDDSGGWRHDVISTGVEAGEVIVLWLDVFVCAKLGLFGKTSTKGQP